MIPTIEEMKEIHNKRRSRGRRQQDMNNILRLVPRSLNFSISAVEEAEQLLVKTKAGEITTFALVALGAGTVISFRLKAGGRTRAYRSQVAEPVPGRVLTETDTTSSAVTTFTVTPTADDRCRVRIETAWQGAGGIGGIFERLFAPGVLRKLYADELARLEAYAREQGP
ncbi:MAG: SRPBCC family protein, partial [Firmicutes bacterium]|nr:SRPBCC family protein [Bacillota bacterium]